MKLKIFVLIFAFYNSAIAQNFININPVYPRYSITKKMVETGYYQPRVDSLLNANYMNGLCDRPFQGVTFFPNWPLLPNDERLLPQSIFTPTLVSSAIANLNQLSQISWCDSKTDNFLYYTLVGSNAEWFNDNQWDVVNKNALTISNEVIAAKAKGIFWDTEHYGSSIWEYNSLLYPNNTYEEVKAKVRQRGYDFTTSLASIKPDIKILASGLWMFTYWNAGGNITNIQNTTYCLLKDFSEGMLDAASREVKIIDGNEIAYNWVNTANIHYQPGANNLVSNPGNFVNSSLLNKNKLFKQVGQSIFYNNFKPINSLVNQKKLEHSIYNTLLTSDEYTWFYSEEDSSFWSRPFPYEAKTAIESGYNKYHLGQKLGFTINNDNFVNYSRDLKIIYPLQNQIFSVGDTISFKTKFSSNVTDILYYSSFESLPVLATSNGSFNTIAIIPGVYTLFAVSNGFNKLSNPVTFFVKCANESINNKFITPETKYAQNK